MNRQQLAHLLRAACQIANDPEVLVLGSQSILGTYDEDDLPAAATASMEADIAFLSDGADRAKADAVDGSIGEMTTFQAAYGVYAEGISVETAVLPDGWRERLLTWDLESSYPARPLFLERHDLAVAKLVAGRVDKDYPFVLALLEAGMLDPALLRERAAMLPDSEGVRRDRTLAWLDALPAAESSGS